MALYSLDDPFPGYNLKPACFSPSLKTTQRSKGSEVTAKDNFFNLPRFIDSGILRVLYLFYPS
jgi:hypothetical protein